MRIYKLVATYNPPEGDGLSLNHNGEYYLNCNKACIEASKILKVIYKMDPIVIPYYDVHVEGVDVIE